MNSKTIGFTPIKENKETICGFEVTSNRKKVWNAELRIYHEFRKICEKHNIKWYAQGGTLIGTIRHKGFVPWDDDIDVIMTREDYEKFRKVAPKELPNNLLLSYYHQGWGKITNIETSALGDENRWDDDFIGGIYIDIFPMDYASKYSIINNIKAIILLAIRMIMISQKMEGFIKRMKKWKQFTAYTCKWLFKWVNCNKLYNLHEKISKKTFFKSKNIYNTRCPYKFYPIDIFDNFHDEPFENTTIHVPDGYDKYLTMQFGEYMTPVIFEGGHHCRYSTNKSFKDIIMGFDKGKSSEENYNNCKDLFVL